MRREGATFHGCVPTDTTEFSVRRVARIHRRPTRDRRRHDLPVGILEQIDDVAPVRGHAIARFALGAIIAMHKIGRAHV